MFAFKKLQSKALFTLTIRSSLGKRLNNNWVRINKLQEKSNTYYNGSNGQSYYAEYIKMVEKIPPHILKSIFLGGGGLMITYVFRLDDKIDALDKKIDNRFDVLTERIDNLDKKIDNRCDALDKKIDNRFDALDKKIDNHTKEQREMILALDKKIDNHTKEQREMILAIGEENRKMILAIAEEQRRSRWF